MPVGRCSRILVNIIADAMLTALSVARASALQPLARRLAS
jgi:hypothetical protein